ncbi:MAG: septum formation initiator family protein [Bacteroidota bacterium]
MKRFRRRFRPRPLTTRRKGLYAALVAVPLLAIFTFGNHGLLNRIELQSHVDQLHRDLYRDRAAGDSLKAEIIKIQRDSSSVERLARERYGMVRSGETIYRVNE